MKLTRSYSATLIYQGEAQVLFRNLQEKAYPDRRVQQLVRRVATAAGIEKRETPHTLRHTWATLLTEAV